MDERVGNMIRNPSNDGKVHYVHTGKLRSLYVPSRARIIRVSKKDSHKLGE